MGGGGSFVASTGWLTRFKSRHGIQQLDIQGEKLSRDSQTPTAFVTNFAKLLTDNHYDSGLVYNADETGLCWKNLPSKTLASQQEKRAPGYKMNKDRVTLIVPGNASGTHRIPMRLNGKSRNPRCFKMPKFR